MQQSATITGLGASQTLATPVMGYFERKQLKTFCTPCFDTGNAPRVEENDTGDMVIMKTANPNAW
jgi:hypothetical protein